MVTLTLVLGPGRSGVLALLVLALLVLLLPVAGESAESSVGEAVDADAGGALRVPFLTRTVSADFPTVNNLVIKGTVIELDGTRAEGAQCCFDTELLRMAILWQGGLRLPQRHGGLEGHAQPVGEVHLGCSAVCGWSQDAHFTDPRPDHQGPLPRSVGRYRGLSLCGSQVILSYEVAATAVLESPDFVHGKNSFFVRSFTIAAHAKPLYLLMGERPGALATMAGNTASLGDASAMTLLGLGAHTPPALARFQAAPGRIMVELPANADVLSFSVALDALVAPTGTNLEPQLNQARTVLTAWQEHARPSDLRTCRPRGPGLWGAPLTTRLILNPGTTAYVTDEVTLPEDNPWKQPIQPTGFDFFPDGRMALCTLSGDVWIIRGLDTLQPTWQRFASGLFQPLGLCVHAGAIYVLGRDQITRLVDEDGDGEADHYVCVSNDTIATDNFHDFALDLHMDRQGDFYFGRGSPWPPQVTSPQQGCLIRISHDGEHLQVIGTGLRSPNGLGISDSGELSFSDNPGPWMPACRLNLVRTEGDFWGMKQTSHTPVPPSAFTPPLLWLPHEVDNSPGGQAWCTSPTWGPCSGHLLLTSYGMGTLSMVLKQEVHGVDQGGIVVLPLSFPSGIMRIRQSPLDGQMWVAGMLGWQCNATKDGCLMRVRYTGAPLRLPTQLQVRTGAIAVTFACALDASSASDPGNWSAAQWNYHWNEEYGSDDYRPSDDKSGREIVDIARVHLEDDGHTAVLTMPHLHAVMQMQLTGKVRAQDGTEVVMKISSTINRVP